MWFEGLMILIGIFCVFCLVSIFMFVGLVMLLAWASSLPDTSDTKWWFVRQGMNASDLKGHLKFLKHTGVLDHNEYIQAIARVNRGETIFKEESFFISLGDTDE